MYTKEQLKAMSLEQLQKIAKELLKSEEPKPKDPYEVFKLDRENLDC